ncbi:bifunctional indole-3-glycerol-phosphate synthase TrpC/phosphoribosylanthranilate isomerase TrpF [Buchnera aphidicola]|uniref:Multifunctional fusion protein n=1 Tax=Buchnera aphidicola (Stegophylla sp.) TaxID=2315800 RepID=A0A4D6Y9H8_9GAMM|nr:bifunctional indole-3-glycerol-phosphate synthase TrpC/phosphoribosylanthranilate isomerase TrpF [Buchnera aphidicola (Stegophylla sp.)]QCI26357.1 bifunctional indole-3-glycerol-phosphate synthase TrpC/phosphoribosylanthranilate isomerase TrpF [Buchnera aphidicola (Stegophylla sp.)]
MKNNILQEIIYHKKIWLNNQVKQQPLYLIKNKLKPSSRQFYHHIQSNHPCFILEIKRSSPSIGIINNNFNINEIVKCYNKHATIISVLTDKKYFGGQFEFLNIVHNLTKKPILCKDFFIHPYQIYFSRYHKADAILLMLSILDDHEYYTLSKIAHNMNMGVLTEINNKSELERAIKLKAKIIGINNRNLYDLSININRTHFLTSLIPKNQIVISESGINNHHQIKKLKNIVHGFLIGSSIMKYKHIHIAVNKILYGNNKICGLTRKKDARFAQTVGAVYGGLIFIPKSIRCINLNSAKRIIHHTQLKYVGIFQNEKIKNIVYITKLLSLHAIQLHGHENQEYIINLKKKLSKKIKIWKAIDITNIKKNKLQYIDYYVFDNTQGGSGKCFDWSILKQYNLKDVFLSGGLSIHNCLHASQLGCFGLDFNSKIEKFPGIKSNIQMKLLFQKLKS